MPFHLAIPAKLFASDLYKRGSVLKFPSCTIIRLGGVLPQRSSPQPADYSDPNRVISAYLELLPVKIARFTPLVSQRTRLCCSNCHSLRCAGVLPYTVFYGAPTFLEVSIAPMSRLSKV